MCGGEVPFDVVSVEGYEEVQIDCLFGGRKYTDGDDEGSQGSENSHPRAAELLQFPSLDRVCKLGADGLNCLGITDGFGHFGHLAPHRQSFLRFPALVKSPSSYSVATQ